MKKSETKSKISKKQEADWTPDLSSGIEEGVKLTVVPQGDGFFITETREDNPNYYKQYISEINPLEEQD